METERDTSGVSFGSSSVVTATGLPSTPSERNLCSDCARYDWRYHLLDWQPLSAPTGYPAGHGRSLMVKSPYGHEYTVNASLTTFQLNPLAAKLRTQSECSFCRLIIQTLRACSTEDKVQYLLQSNLFIYCKFFDCFMKADNSALVVLIRNPPLMEGVSLEFSLFTSQQTTASNVQPESPMYKRMRTARSKIPSSEINPMVIQNWWEECRTLHDCKEERHSSGELKAEILMPLLASNSVFRVIDVTTDRVLSPSGQYRYVALSYVWGITEGYTTRKSDFIYPANNSRATDEGYIQLTRQDLPSTIQDAMLVTYILGERYLWVDALCIVQDDAVEKALLINCMDRIYRNAALTIIAAGGSDANSGLGGLHPGSRNIPSFTAILGGVSVINSEAEPDIRVTSWATRGWTYQESHFSSRALISMQDRVYYSCGKGSFGEARPKKSLWRSILRGNYPNFLSSPEYLAPDWFLFAQYVCHVKEYTRRTLHYECDILNAFHGLLGDLRTSGLPAGEYQ